MAQTQFASRTAENEKKNAPIRLLSVGAFGQSVGRYLRDLRTDVVEEVLTGNALPALEACLYILVASRPAPQLCEMLDEAGHESGRPYFPLILDSNELRLGPIVVPGQGGCWRCWVRRSAQHADWSKERSVLLQYYASNPTAGPRGYLEPFAMIAAAQIAETLKALGSSTRMAGHIWQMNLMTRQITTSTLVSTHDCPRCGLRRPAPDRSVAEMKDALTFLWQQERHE